MIVPKKPTGEWVPIQETIDELDKCPRLKELVKAHIAARQEAEDWLQRLSLVMSLSPNSILITDLEGNIEYANEEFSRVSGYQNGELIGKNPRILQSGQTPSTTYDDMWKKLRAGRPWEGEFINKRRDGTVYIEFARISPIGHPHGQITNYVAIEEDITEKKRIAEELENYHQHLEELVTVRTAELAAAKEVAESANRAKSAFLANMSHEIRTPLTAIIGFGESLLESGSSMAERIEAISIILRNGRHLQSLLNDILDLSKIEAGQLIVERIPMSLLELFSEIESSHYAQARTKGLEFSVDYLLPLPRTILTDPTRLRQILFNLCGNAVKFTEQGKIRVAVSCDREHQKLVASVFDTGPGLTQAQCDRLFKPFSQGDVSITRRHGGTGLGLNISRYLAKRLGGEVTVESSYGHGSLFVATVDTGPLDDVEWVEDREQWVIGNMGTHTDREQSLRPARLKGSVLLAEDTPDNQRLISFYLHRAGVAVEVVATGEKAVEKALVGNFDLILMDMQMPVMDGLSATALLRQTGFGRPIVALTANASTEDRTRCLNAGCTAFLAKPVDWNQFYTVLSTYLLSADSESSVTPVTDLMATDTEYQEMAAHFRKGLPDRLTELSNAGNEARWEDVRRLAHQLKGVAASFGMPEVTRIAGDLEFQATRSATQEVFSLLADLHSACGLSIGLYAQ